MKFSKEREEKKKKEKNNEYSALPDIYPTKWDTVRDNRENSCIREDKLRAIELEVWSCCSSVKRPVLFSFFSNEWPGYLA